MARCNGGQGVEPAPAVTRPADPPSPGEDHPRLRHVRAPGGAAILSGGEAGRGASRATEAYGGKVKRAIPSRRAGGTLSAAAVGQRALLQGRAEAGEQSTPVLALMQYRSRDGLLS